MSSRTWARSITGFNTNNQQNKNMKMTNETEAKENTIKGQDTVCLGESLQPRRLNFHDLRIANVKRTAQAFHPVEHWSPTDWATAMAGECGEACNKIKKLRRGEIIAPEEIAHELADMIIYADLLAARLGINLEQAIIQKFNMVSDRPRPASTVRL
jgi:NTP pyrophosphatase (non-canonical NTP hydrolase)